MQVTIAGSGGWGTALAILLHENGHDVTLWSHFETESKQLAETHQNPYLPGVTLPEGLHYSADPACAQGREMVVFATPSFAVRTTARAFAPYLAETPLLVSVTKGIEEGTGYRMSELVSQETGRTVVALSGPSHAEEVSRGIPTGVVVACPERELAERVQNAFMCSRFRVYTSPDTAGIELGAALKNVIALCAGVCDGMGYGDNTKALLMTRGLAEHGARNDGQSGQTYRAFTQEVPAGYFFRHDVMFWLGFYLTNFDTLRYSALLRAQSMGGSELASIST